MNMDLFVFALYDNEFVLQPFSHRGVLFLYTHAISLAKTVIISTHNLRIG